MIPGNFEGVWQEVAKRRCLGCHGKDDKGNVKVPRKAWLRINRPELNYFMLAPLAKKAGGTESCGTAVFGGRGDVDYQAILKTFEPLEAMLRERPRMDLVREESGGGKEMVR